MEDKALSQDLETRFHGEDTEKVRLRRFLNTIRDQFRNLQARKIKRVERNRRFLKIILPVDVRALSCLHWGGVFPQPGRRSWQ